MVSDGEGGAFITWQDRRNEVSTRFDIYAQRIESNGNVLWEENGVVVCEEILEQENARICRDNAGGIFIAWEDSRNDPIGLIEDIYAQRIDGDGNVLWEEGGVEVCTDDENQGYIEILSDGNEGLFIIWRDDRNGDFPHCDIYAQYFNPDGTINWTENGISICSEEGMQEQPIIVPNNADGFLAFWSDSRNSEGIFYQSVDDQGALLFAQDQIVKDGVSGSIYDIFALNLPNDKNLVIWSDNRHLFNQAKICLQIVDNEGIAELSEDGVILCDPGEQAEQESPQAVLTDDNEVIIVWEDGRESNYSIPQIYAQKIDLQGNVMWNPEGILLYQTAANFDQQEPVICSDSEGGAFIAWTEYITPMFNLALFIHRISSGGSLVWGEEPLQIEIEETEDLDNYEVNIEADGSGNAVLAWRSGSFITDFDIFGAKVTADGDTAWTTSVCDADDWQMSPVMEITPEGDYLVLWLDRRTGNDYDIYAQKFDNEGNTLWQEDGILIVAEDEEQINPQMVVDDEGYIFVIWGDERNGLDHDIYCQRVSPAGELMFAGSGLLVAGGEGDQINSVFIADNAGGAYITWQDHNADFPYYPALKAVHLNALGEIADPVWQAGGNPVLQLDYDYQVNSIMIPDNYGGAVAFWVDVRAGFGSYSGYNDLYAMRMNDFSTGIPDLANDTQTPVQFRLYPAYPNPFNPKTTIRFDLPSAGQVELKVYDVTGREVAALGTGHWALGQHSVVWNAEEMSSGMYFVRLAVDDRESMVKKVVLMK